MAKVIDVAGGTLLMGFAIWFVFSGALWQTLHWAAH